jgi:hypothetical protein
MEINTGHQRVKLLQTFITVLLILILAGMIGGYIYYGMYLAKTAEVVAVPAEPGAGTDMDDARRAEIIKALSQEPVSMDEAEKQAIIDDLKASPPDQTAESEERRAEMIRALQQN